MRVGHRACEKGQRAGLRRVRTHRSSEVNGDEELLSPWYLSFGDASIVEISV